jgi:hypothetical protein
MPVPKYSFSCFTNSTIDYYLIICSPVDPNILIKGFRSVLEICQDASCQRTI